MGISSSKLCQVRNRLVGYNVMRASLNFIPLYFEFIQFQRVWGQFLGAMPRQPHLPESGWKRFRLWFDDGAAYVYA